MIKLCSLLDLKDRKERAFFVTENIEIFIICVAEKLFAYYNRCPHTGAPLNWQADQFLDASGEFIQCSGHDAMFQIKDGLCLSGPCRGQFLEPLQLSVINDNVYLSV